MTVKRQESRVESQKRRLGLRSQSGPRLSTLDPRPIRLGLTLIELLIVIIILTTLVAAAIPLMSPTTADRRIREASRGLNAFITGAQMRAVEIQRPFGVGFKKLGQDTGSSEDNGICLEVFQVEQPSPFVGFDETSAVRVSLDKDAEGRNGVRLQFVVRGDTNDILPHGWDYDQLPPYTIRQGDVVEVQGTHFELTDDDTDNGGFYRADSGFPDGELFAVPVNDTGQLMNFVDADPTRDDLFWTNPIRYKVLRQPMPVGEPFQLPEGTAIDLRASGERIVIDENKNAIQRVPEGEFGGFFHNPDFLTPAKDVNNSEPVIVMFSPEGSIERVKFNKRNELTGEENEPFDAPVVSNIYLLVGEPENVPPVPPDDPTLDPATYPPLTDELLAELRQSLNWLSGESRWIVIGAQSGRVVTVENAFVSRQALIGIANMMPELGLTRRARQIRASRELAHQMAQLGGR